MHIHIGKAHKTEKVTSPEKERSTFKGDDFSKSEPSIPQVDGTFDQNAIMIRGEKVQIKAETQIEKVSETFPVLRNWFKEIKKECNL